MNIREINKPVTAKSLNESLAKRFGERVALEKFSIDQLQDVRNKLRTTLSQTETTESFDAVNSSSSYQKNRLFLDVLNAEISERAAIKEAECDKCECDPCECKKTNEGEMPAGLKKHMEKKNKDNKADEKDTDKGGPKDHGRRPDSPDLDKDGNTDEPIGDAAKDAKKESIVREGAEDQAELVMAAKNMVDKVTSWMEDTAEMQTESMLELADAIRDEKSQAESEAFVNTVKPALESLYTAMESTRQSLTQGVGQLTGEAEAVDTMGDEEMPADDMAMEPTVDAEGEDDFAASEPAVGGEEEAGRAKRESKYYAKKRMLESSRRLGTIFSKKK
jgi:hypothetical protein